MKKSYIYIIFCLILVFLPFYNPQKAFAREVPTIRISTDKTYPVRVMDGTKPTNDFSVYGFITKTEPADQVAVWLTQTGKGTDFKIWPQVAKINKDTSGKAYSFNVTFKDLETGRYAVHSTIDYVEPEYKNQSGATVAAKNKKTLEVLNTKNPTNYTTKVFDVTAVPIIRGGEIKVKHLGNDNFRVTTTIDTYDSTKNYSIYLKEKEKGTEIKNTSIARENSDKTTSQNLFAEFYNISGSFTAHVVYKEGLETIGMAQFSFSTGEVIDKGEIVGNKKTIDNGNVIDPKINDVTVDVSENGNTFVLGITGADIPENSLYEVVILDKSAKNTSNPTYIAPSTGGIKATNVGGFLDMKVTYTFNQIPKSGSYYVITKIKKPDTAKTELARRDSEIILNKEDKTANVQSANIYEVPNTTIPSTGEYKLLVPLPGIGDTFDYSAPGAFQNLINTIIKLIFGAITVWAVLTTIRWGIVYMVSDKEFTKSESKTKILNAIIAIVLALSSYLILNTVNPDLVNISINGQQANISVREIEFISQKKFEESTGEKRLSKERYQAEAKKVTAQMGIPYCALQVILERESKGDPGAIGFDENTTRNGSSIPSRVSFINSGKRYNGSSFTPSNTLITDKSITNQKISEVKTNVPGLGLDWRFSKGIGLTQITLFPEGYFSGTVSFSKNPLSFDKRDTYPTRTIQYTKDGKTIKETLTPKDLLKTEKNLLAGASVWKDSWLKCNKDPYGAWVGYGSGPGNCIPKNNFIREEAKIRMEYYNGCIKQFGSQ